MNVLQIKNHESYPWILQKHYAKRIPSIMYSFGLYENKELIGVVTYGIPASYTLCEGICGKENKHLVLELNRLCLLHNAKNEASYLISHSLKLLPKPSIIVSYADVDMGHIGYVYQATNFLFTGTTKERTDMASTDNRHHRHASDPSVREKRSAKNRYVYLVGKRQDKKRLQQLLNYPVMPYPKGDIKRYDSGGVVETQGLLFA